MCLIRPAVHLCRTCATALPIDVRPLQSPPCSGRHELGMAHFGLSSGLQARMLECAAADWSPWLSATSTSKLEQVQLDAALAITGLVIFDPVEAVTSESLLPTISTRFLTITLLKADAFHQPTIVFTACRQRLKRKDWRNTEFFV